MIQQKPCEFKLDSSIFFKFYIFKNPIRNFKATHNYSAEYTDTEYYKYTLSINSILQHESVKVKNVPDHMLLLAEA